MKNLAYEYNKNGYVIVKNILNENEVNSLREYINTNLDRPGKKFVSSKELLEYKNIYSLLFREKILNSCKQIMGERFYLIPDFHIHMNLFGSKLKSYKPAWHIDSGSEGNKKYLTEESYKFAKLGIYLQDNLETYGGGIYALPKGHKFYLKFLPISFQFLLKKIINYLMINFFSEMVQTKKGDAIIFDSRLPHASVLPKKEKLKNSKVRSSTKIDLDTSASKYAFYCDITDKNNYKPFIINAKKRFQNEKYDNNFFEYTTLDYPNDFPDDFVKLVKKSNVNIATLKK